MSRSPLIALVLATLLSGSLTPALGYSGGSGTPADPYQIAIPADWQQLMATPTHWNKHFILTADLTLAGLTLTPVGNSTTKFTGTFDGQDHIISNATINLPNNEHVGLFGYLDTGAIISNLGVTGGKIAGGRHVGGLAGYNNAGVITACYAASPLSGLLSVGGLVGCNCGTVAACYATGAVTAACDAGGLAGRNWHGAIAACYATGAVRGWSVPPPIGYVGGLGGLVGYSYYDTITASYATGSVTGSFFPLIISGGLVGDTDNGTITECFWDRQTSAQPFSAGGTPKSTSEMKTLSTFTSAGWDFIGENDPTGDWIMLPNDYPKLVWQPRAVPALRGLTLLQAQSVLSTAGFSLGESYLRLRHVPRPRSDLRLSSQVWNPCLSAIDRSSPPTRQEHQILSRRRNFFRPLPNRHTRRLA